MNDTINILLVEDEPDLVLIIRNTLTSQGFNVRTATDGEEGLRKFYAEKPDVLVADAVAVGIVKALGINFVKYCVFKPLRHNIILSNFVVLDIGYITIFLYLLQYIFKNSTFIF